MKRWVGIDYFTFEPGRFDAGKFDRVAKKLHCEVDETHLKFLVAQLVFAFSHIHVHDTALTCLERRGKLKEPLVCAGEIEIEYSPARRKMSGISDSLWMARKLSPLESQKYLTEVLAPMLRGFFEIEGDYPNHLIYPGGRIAIFGIPTALKVGRR
ncbi:hypothetical protein A2634_00270 [Candidatus Amesbacteria bacterium RIFCSPHIGHO2_01_FULL_48_32]|uniref:Uncharacterized protein n=1 Tax=Candidatus Amesbacteria bacterium RIFCSPLOWO2_01_FULL_48_25 TaxID=1797259 RepID=A0A1F4ZAC0_9BACT|nr:MAG: hypothetical protein A2634_00270 [Candidatus Amesbacteria bacterium RIFCSPHIGHO2_01_FULL_48_32]OGD03243.1 MAG: hypothetical protein A2989_00220 [Candidatus Amesbacteria bacterium RIFCSPLOWO2_01_FULL_48_25]HJZ05188.1 hypothetical protein [Patescibacteria group bacterium]